MKAFLAALALGSALLGGCRGRSLPADTLVTVNGEPITGADLKREMAFQVSKDPAAVLEDLIDQAVLLQEAARLGAELRGDALQEQLELARAGTPEAEFMEGLRQRGLNEAEWRERLRRQATIDEAVRRAIRASIPLTQQELKDYYWEHVTQFRRSESVNLRQVFTTSRRQAEKAQAELELGEPFAEVAHRYSRAPEALEGGALGWVTRKGLPEKLAQAAFKLKKGQVSPIVASHYGYHILMAEDRRPEQNLSLEQAAPEIRSAVLRDKEQPRYRDWLFDLRGKAEIRRLRAPSKTPERKP